MYSNLSFNSFRIVFICLYLHRKSFYDNEKNFFVTPIIGKHPSIREKMTYAEELEYIGRNDKRNNFITIYKV